MNSLEKPGTKGVHEASLQFQWEKRLYSLQFWVEIQTDLSLYEL